MAPTSPPTDQSRLGLSPRRILLPLALAQFICSFAGSNMNVMINDISADLDTTVQGVQAAITIFLLVMAALMIPGGKLTDRFGRKTMLAAGTAGLLIGFAVPLIGSLAAGGLFLYFTGALVAHLRVGSRNLAGWAIFYVTVSVDLVVHLLHH